MRLSASSLCLALALPGVLSAQQVDSLYSSHDWARDCERVDRPAPPDAAAMGARIVCPGPSGMLVMLADSDLRISMDYGRAARFGPWESFASFSDVAGTIEWRRRRIGGRMRPFATIHRWTVGPKEAVRELLVVSTVAQGAGEESCIVGLVDATATDGANALARELADRRAAQFACGADRPRAYGRVTFDTPCRGVSSTNRVKRRTTMLRNIAAACALVLAPVSFAAAEGQLTYTADAGKMGRMEMTERWTAEALRMDIEGMDAYMLLKGDEVYSVTVASGQVMVFPLSQLKTMAGAGGNAGPSADQAGVVFPEEISTMRATGETREVAGIEGEIYDVDWTDNSGTARTVSAVLTDDPRLLEHQDLKMRFIRQISGEEPNPLMTEMQDRGLAALTFGDRFRVLSLTDDAGPAGDFELPAAPVDFGDMMKMGNQ